MCLFSGCAKCISLDSRSNYNMDMKTEPKNASREDEGKIIEKYVCKNFFSKLEGWHLANLGRINFFVDNL